MPRFKQSRSFRRRLASLLAATTAATLIVASFLFGVTEIRVARENQLRRIDALASVLGFNSLAAIAFRDANDATTVLKSLRQDTEVLSASIRLIDGSELAKYDTGIRSLRIPEKFEEGSFIDATGDLVVIRAIRNDDELVGAIYLRATGEPMRAQIRETLALTGLAFLVIFLGTAFLARRVAQSLAGPLARLADATQTVAVQGDYSVRVEKEADDEVGVLCDSFNDMLKELQRRDVELEAHRKNLEELVAKRTRDLEVKTQEALAASVAKSEFLANMSHEIRTPMTAILGYTDLLLADPQLRSTLPGRLEDLQTIRRNGEHLIHVINDILDLSKIEAGKLFFQPTPVRLVQVMADVVSLMRVRAESKGLALDLRYDGRIPETIVTDPVRLRQILFNLTGNAIKFTDKGNVRMEVSFAEEATARKLTIRVVDTGIGMTQAEVEQLFRPFSQADSSSTRRYSGAGLGLVISKRLARMLGGDIDVHSDQGQGSVFTLTIDPGEQASRNLLENVSESGEGITSTKPIANVNEPRPDWLAGRVLVVDDGADNRRLIAYHLRREGAEVTTAENGKLAVDIALSATQSGQPFLLILMDMQMPVLDGYDAARELRSAGYAGPIVALTAHAMSGDREKCLEAGCDDYAAKPIDKAQLLAAIQRAIQKRS